MLKSVSTNPKATVAECQYTQYAIVSLLVSYLAYCELVCLCRLLCSCCVFLTSLRPLACVCWFVSSAETPSLRKISRVGSHLWLAP